MAVSALRMVGVNQILLVAEDAVSGRPAMLRRASVSVTKHVAMAVPLDRAVIQISTRRAVDSASATRAVVAVVQPGKCVRATVIHRAVDSVHATPLVAVAAIRALLVTLTRTQRAVVSVPHLRVVLVHLDLPAI